jgi:hypothetical protein
MIRHLQLVLHAQAKLHVAEYKTELSIFADAQEGTLWTQPTNGVMFPVPLLNTMTPRN